MYSMRKSKSFISGALAVILSIIMVFGCCGVFASAAVSYSGKGTSSSPYLIYTAEQLDGIRNNLSAHYKLANTIDASSLGTFQPLGILARPFKGSLTCDLKEDGTPKYVIKNLKLYNKAGEVAGHTMLKPESYTDYSLNNSKWETGLFGATAGAIIENIVILDADVTSTVLGQHDQNSDFTINPGMREEQGTGILAGIIKNTQIKGCGATGKINSKSNNTGGLIGLSLDGSAISYSWVKASMTTSGAKEIGGFIGMCYTGGTTIKNCFSDSNITHSVVALDGYAVGGFVGNSLDLTVTDCYSSGSINMGYSFILVSWNTSTIKAANCYSSVKTPTASPINQDVIPSQDCCVLSGCFQPQWKTVSDAALKAAFAGKSAWDIAGNYPTLHNVSEITNASLYVPEANTGNSTQQTDTQQGSDSANPEDSSGDNEIASMIETINSWPSPDNVTITLKDEVKKIKREYDKFGDAEFAAFPEETYTKLMSVCDKMNILILSYLAEEINKLPEVKKLTLKNSDKVLGLYDDYNFLPKETKSLLREDYVKQLKASVKKINELNKKASGVIVSAAVNPAETVLIIVLAVLSAGCFGVSVWVLIMFKKLVKANKVPDESLDDADSTEEEPLTEDM